MKLKLTKYKTMKLVVNILMGIFILVTCLTALTVYSLPLKQKLFVVESGSMSPTIKTGGLILATPKQDYQIDDIITYKVGLSVNLKSKDATITHRIVELKQADDGSIIYITKGDNNANRDTESVTPVQVIGEVILTIPIVGYLISFTKTQAGLILLIVIPATLIIYSEIINIKKELDTLIKSRRKTKKQKAAKKR